MDMGPTTSFPPVRIEGLLGHGMTSTVYRGRVGARPVVVKQARDPAGAGRLAWEAFCLSVLGTATTLGLAEVRDAALVAAEDGRPCLVMDLREGVPLFSAGEADGATLLRDLGAQLALAHAAGLAHGDVKPANIIVSSSAVHLIDWGLATWTDARELDGATPRYLARGDRTLGDGRARDLLALGLVLAEHLAPGLRRVTELLREARAQDLPTALGAMAQALLVPSPWARPGARWLATAQSAELAADFHVGMVRATYLRLHHPQLGRATKAAAPTAAWLTPVLETTARARELCRRVDTPLPQALEASSEPIRPLDLEGRRRWLVALAGPAASEWVHLGLDVDEERFAAALGSLARRVAPSEWSLPLLEAAVAGAPTPSAAPLLEPPGSPDGIAALTLGVARHPPDAAALACVERHADTLPSSLRRAAADALRLAGHLGRAHALVARDDSSDAMAAEVLRRSGELERAAAQADRALDTQPTPRLRACRARIALDGGDPSLALALGDAPAQAAEAEVAALGAAATGARERAVSLARRTIALAHTHEERARAAATLAYVVGDRDPREAARGWRDAVAHAVRAGAILEEATYRTGEASTAVDEGHLDRAVDTAARAALLWDDVLHRPDRAARAWLAGAAAHAAVDDAPTARFFAQQAITRALRGGDPRAAAYAWWAIADAVDATSPDGARAAEEAARLLQEPSDDDRVHAAARQVRFGGDAIPDLPVDRVSTQARLAFWTARAERCLLGDHEDDVDAVLGQLSSLRDLPGPVVAKGKAMHHGARLAARAGRSDVLEHLEAARRIAVAQVRPHTQRRGLAEAAAACAWLQRPSEGDALSDEQAVDLQQLVRALSERESLEVLLGRVLDLLLLWTGAERGLMLLREPDGTLAPRSARNLARDELHPEQLELSTTLAQRAVDRREAVVAVDAMAELSQAHQSVHALQLRSVLALPLMAKGEVVGVAYLDDRMRRAAFGRRELQWARAIAPVAALAVSDARAQQKLREAVSTAELAQQRLETALAEKESALDVASRELAATRPRGRAFARIIGRSEALERTLRLVERVAPSDVPVLLLGESGSGKELLARALHEASSRAARPFVGENCGALPETLLESALFGHVKGAFTGAHRPRVGLFEAADGGTLFLDEIGEMSLAMQTKLLRVLEDSLVRPVGATDAKKVDVRIVAATHRDLPTMVREGSFREDLFYRLDVISIPIPPLRDRAGDVELLVAHFLDKHAAERSLGLTSRALDRLRRFGWPGNVRQLENEIRRAVLLADDEIDIGHLTIDDDATPHATPGSFDLKERIDQLERDLVGRALERTEGNQTQAAKLLGVSRYGLHKMIKRLDIPVPGRDT